MLRRFADVVCSATGLVVLAPLFLLVGAALKITSPGPVFFRQVRMGRNGASFRICKFRSMVWAGNRPGPLVTAAGDSRVTRIGEILRRHKLDELPQLWNVLRGEMSLVGPRPEVPEIAAHYPEEFSNLLRVRPGITHPVTQLFRHEEEILASVPEPQEYYVQSILPRKLALYLADPEGGGIGGYLRIIFATVFNRKPSADLSGQIGAPGQADRTQPVAEKEGVP